MILLSGVGSHRWNASAKSGASFDCERTGRIPACSRETFETCCYRTLPGIQRRRGPWPQQPRSSRRSPPCRGRSGPHRWLVNFSSRDQVPPGRNRSLESPPRPVFAAQRAKTPGSIPGSSTQIAGQGHRLWPVFLFSPPSRVSLPSDDPSPVHLPAAADTKRSVGVRTARRSKALVRLRDLVVGRASLQRKS